MTDTIIKSGENIQLLLSQKGVQAQITLIVIVSVMIMLIIGREIPDWAMYMASGLVGLYFDVPGKQTNT